MPSLFGKSDGHDGLPQKNQSNRHDRNVPKLSPSKSEDKDMSPHPRLKPSKYRQLHGKSNLDSFVKDETSCLVVPTAATRNLSQKYTTSIVDDEEVLRAALSSSIFCANLDEVLMKLSGDSIDGFVYLSQARHSANYYSLKVVSYSECCESDYFTCSRSGISHFINGKMEEFTPMQVWKREHELCQALSKFSVFATFRKWKPFIIWKKIIKKGNIKQKIQFLESRLIQCEPSFLDCLVSLRLSWLELESFVPSLFLSSLENNPQLSVFEFSRDESKQTRSAQSRMKSTFLSNVELVKSIFSQAEGHASIQGGEIDQVFLSASVQMKVRTSNQAQKQNYAERVVKRSLQLRLLRFARLCDYLLASSLHSITIKSISMLQRKFALDPLSCSPSFVTQVVWEGNSLALQPSYIEFSTEIEGILTFIARDLVCIEASFVDHPDLKEFWMSESASEALSTNSKIAIVKEILTSDNVLNAALRSLNFVCKKAYTKASESLQHLVHQMKLLGESFSFDFSEIERDGLQSDTSFSNLTARLRELKEMQRRIEKVPDEISVHFLQLRCSNIKKASLSTPVRYISLLQKFILRLLSDKKTQLSEFMVGATAYLTGQCTSLEEFVAIRQYAVDVEHSVAKLELEIDEMSCNVKNLLDLEVHFPKATLASFLSLQVQFDTMKANIDAANELYYRKKNYWIEKLDQEINYLKKHVPELKRKIEDPKYLDITASMQGPITELADQIHLMQERSKLLFTWSSILGTVGEDVPDFSDLHSRLLLRLQLWKMNEETQYAITDALNQYVKDFQVNAGKSKVQEWSSFLMRVKRELPANTLLEKVSSQVDTYKKMVDICGLILNPAMKSRHWDKIYIQTGHRLNPFRSTNQEEYILVDSLFKLREYSMSFYRVSQDASEEHALEIILSKMQADWVQKEFTIVRYVGREDVHILGDTDELQKSLDESLSSISVVLASKQAEAVRAEAESQQTALREIQNYLDHWAPIQINWIHLEPIFASSDIQRQLPSEAKQFALIEREFRKVMKRAADNPSCLKLCKAEGLRETFHQLNNNFERIRRSLRDYLEMKRMAFPRFFFLSDDELLNILAQSRNIKLIQDQISKCFQGVQRFVLTESEHSANGFTSSIASLRSLQSSTVNATFLTDPVLDSMDVRKFIKIDIQGMISMEDEHVYFDSAIKV